MTEVVVGDVLGPVRVGPVAHGGHWVTRVEGRVFFVRHALEGELVRLVVTGLSRRFGRADVAEVLEPSPHRVPPPCPVAGRCGGCDLQHVEPAHTRELKRQVVAEQLQRLAGMTWTGEVEPVAPWPFGWRTRMRYHNGPGGPGLRAARSHEVVPLPEQGCLIADPSLRHPEAHGAGGVPSTASAGGVLGTASADGVRWTPPGADETVVEEAAGRRWRVSTDGFWQVHPAAAQTLVDAVLPALGVRAGEAALDLFCGVGLFAGALVDAGARVTGVEGNRAAVEHARANVPQARFLAGSVDRVLRTLPGRFDVVVLDPPREGAGRVVMTDVLARTGRAVAYVACDPAALARDLAIADAAGWSTTTVRAFDLFPMTHHVECVALLTKTGSDLR